MPALTVLLVEDDPCLQRSLSVRLKQWGHKVLTAADAGAAIAIAQQHAPDVALMDICLPDGDAFQVMEYLHALAVTAGLPVVFISAQQLADVEHRLREFGAAEFLGKPFAAADLESAISRLIS